MFAGLTEGREYLGDVRLRHFHTSTLAKSYELRAWEKNVEKFNDLGFEGTAFSRRVSRNI